MSKPRVCFISVVASPYQRDIFAALSQRSEIDLRVFYMEHAAPDSPWPDRALAPYESILPGFWIPLGAARCHLNWRLPSILQYDLLVLNTVMSITAQRLMRSAPRRARWAFWGERFGPRRSGWRGRAHDLLTAPLHQARGIVSIGSLAESDNRARFPEPAHFNIPYHCTLTPFMDRPNAVSSDEPVFLFCGQMIARKGLDILLDAFTRVHAACPRARLLLVGREAELPPLLAALPVEVRARVEYAGFQPPEDLPRFFAQASVFILPSRYDGWGVVVNQALGAGLPILCSDTVGAAHDLVTPGENGWIFPAGEATALAEHMERLALSAETRISFGAASRRKASAWTPEQGAEKWVQAIQTMIAPVVPTPQHA